MKKVIHRIGLLLWLLSFWVKWDIAGLNLGAKTRKGRPQTRDQQANDGGD